MSLHTPSGQLVGCADTNQSSTQTSSAMIVHHPSDEVVDGQRGVNFGDAEAHVALDSLPAFAACYSIISILTAVSPLINEVRLSLGFFVSQLNAGYDVRERDHVKKREPLKEMCAPVMQNES